MGPFERVCSSPSADTKLCIGGCFSCLGNSLWVNANLNTTLLHTGILDPVYIIHSILTTVWNMCSTREACYSRRNRAKCSFEDSGGVEPYKPSVAFDFQYSLRSALRGDVHGFYFLISEAVSS